jgi:hypothetical protein
LPIGTQVGASSSKCSPIIAYFLLTLFAQQDNVGDIVFADEG